MWAAPPTVIEQPVSPVVSSSTVNHVKEINIFLSLPENCRAHNEIYDELIQQLRDCRARADGVKNGCNIKLSLSKYRSQCADGTVVLFPDTKE